ncbi:EAL domain, c-di-GMP-specific phosphodiesterase class I (or its enzymatically inactive variant) [Humidesulfovibrio mexicanus]|uniref:EAL domain, c-di-GMP-specific phosphodiesterase class I (Or its enzymatically inactive variant) n=1 Tax=Humidesulfovibrio mexicanus TaxID=147047 RepID=A0A239A813_9BACT|nr:EAL domain-containing protein [Humidesulfovibrio mexicanus]SNR91184.1 EAL domain, c-di-GMP-specific phosphodiesterase class I (or its enzymatically inactive variant) [Humidesulfovibrio mexicanus]
MPASTASPLSGLDTSGIQAVLESENISVFFQPVVSVRSKSILGFEAFSRSLSESGPRLDAHDLFGQNWGAKTRLELCRLCRRKALEAFRPIFERHPQMLLFLNTDGGGLAAAHKNGHLEAVSQALRIPGKRIVVELERPWLNLPEVARFVLYYRERGMGLSVDLCGGMGLPVEELFALKPDFIKFDRPLFTDVQGQEFKRDMVQSLMRLSDKLGSVLIAKNVEAEDEALLLLQWGVNHQQGFYYTKDKDSTERDPIRAFQQKVEEINRRYRESAHACVADKRKRYEDYHKTLKKVAYKMADCREHEFAAACERIVSTEPTLVCASVLTDDGVQLTPLAFRRDLAVDSPLLGPERGRGTDHGIREDVLHLKSGFDKYVLPQHISPFAKVTVSAISARFYNAEGAPYILCLEFLVQ